MERTLQQRARMYNRDLGIASVDAVPTLGDNMEFLRELVRSVVREELQRQRLDHSTPAVSSLADVVREEVRLAIRNPQPIRERQHYAQPEVPPQLSQRVSYADALLQGPPARMDVAATSVYSTAPPSTLARKSAVAPSNRCILASSNRTELPDHPPASLALEGGAAEGRPPRRA
ncbi:hypothetical protein MTO96_016412 [Rhipicephalus appendiculatus]